MAGFLHGKKVFFVLGVCYLFGLFWWLAGVCLFVLRFNDFVVCLLGAWESCKCEKACFSQFWGLLWGWLILVYLGLEGLG